MSGRPPTSASPAGQHPISVLQDSIAKSLIDADMQIRAARSTDAEAIWRILEPVIAAGETYPLPRDLDRAGALAYWFGPNHEVHVATSGEPADPPLLGTYYLRPNNAGGGAHVANCGYMVAAGATHRGVARAMCATRSPAPESAVSAPCSSIS